MEEIRQKIKNILNSMGFMQEDVEIKKDNSFKNKELLMINVKMTSEQADFFLKEGALGLSSLQHLIRVLNFKELHSQSFIVVDINNYKKEREKFLVDLALKTVEKIRKSKKSVILEPMPAYERRFIHLELAEYPDIVTESTGQEPERRVVVKLYP